MDVDLPVGRWRAPLKTPFEKGIFIDSRLVWIRSSRRRRTLRSRRRRKYRGICGIPFAQPQRPVSDRRPPHINNHVHDLGVKMKDREISIAIDPKWIHHRVHLSLLRGYPQKLPKPNRLDFTGFGADSQIETTYVKYLEVGSF